MKDDQKRMVLAMVLSVVVLFGWEKFFAPKKVINNNPVSVSKTNNQNTSNVENENENESETNKQVNNVKTNLKNNPKDFSFKNVSSLTLEDRESLFKFDNDYNISNFKSVNSKRKFKDIFTTEKLGLMIEINGVLKKVLFDQFEKLNNKITAHNSLYNITATFRLNGAKVNYKISSDKKYRFSFNIRSKEKKLPNNQIKQFIVYSSKDVDRYSIDSDKAGESKLKWFGLDFDYHLFVNVLKTTVPVLYSIKDNNLTTTFVNATNNIEGFYSFVFKEYDFLNKLGDKGDNLHLAVDFGFFGIVAVPILRALQFFYKYLGNYGLAIIFLTILLRLLTFPLQFKSFKSMKKMQQVQPELKIIKEKFKDNPQKVQQETMALFKKVGANPLGGCLPMVLQMPVFFAFYKVLYSAVELVDAPFYFWIYDLSVKDPYYVLPVLMTITMFIQNKLNPSASADPTQQKMMMFMPLIFGFIMKDLPAGLNLYMTFSMGLGSIQQLMVYKFSD